MSDDDKTVEVRVVSKAKNAILARYIDNAGH